MMGEDAAAPLAGRRVVARAGGVAAAYAMRLLGAMGADSLLLEPPGGCALRHEPPLLGDGCGPGALFAYLAAGARSLVCDLEAVAGRATLAALLSEADIFIDDTPVDLRAACGLDRETVAARHPDLIHVSVLPFGATGPKAGWKAEEITLLHASGEGNLLPNGLSLEMFPDRPPVKIYGHFATMQGGIAAALGALSALWARDRLGGQFVDVASQDAALAVAAFSVQRFGDGVLEHRGGRSFRYGGVLPCADGYVELLTLEQRQWDALVEVMGRPGWMLDPALADPLERGRRGGEINRLLRAWARERKVADIVALGQPLGVPLARYSQPIEVLADPHVRHRGLFTPVTVDGAGTFDMLVAPFRFDAAPLHLRGGPPALGDAAGQPGGGASPW